MYSKKFCIFALTITAMIKHISLLFLILLSELAASGSEITRHRVEQALMRLDSVLALPPAPLAADTAGIPETRFARRLDRSSLYDDAISLLAGIDPASMTTAERADFYATRGRTAADAAASARDYAARQRYIAIAGTSLDSAIRLLPQNSATARVLAARAGMLRGDSVMAAAELSDICDQTNPATAEYAEAASLLARYYRSKPENADDYMLNLTRAVTSGMLSGNPSPEQMIHLSGQLFIDGDIHRADACLNAAGLAAQANPAERAYAELLPPLDGITDAVIERDKSTFTTICITWGTAFILLMAATIFFFTGRRNLARRRNMVDSLETSLHTREMYINRLLDICAVYVEGLEDFNRLVGRKLKVGQTKDLYDMIESGKIIREQSELFFGVFDDAVLAMFPGFVDQVNDLLQPDKHLDTARNVLTPELRILAFMRLGVSDAGRISKFLGLSLNTVYTYRNRMKSRAINRDTFEADLMRIH